MDTIIGMNHDNSHECTTLFIRNSKGYKNVIRVFNNRAKDYYMSSDVPHMSDEEYEELPVRESISGGKH